MQQESQISELHSILSVIMFTVMMMHFYGKEIVLNKTMTPSALLLFQIGHHMKDDMAV